MRTALKKEIIVVIRWYYMDKQYEKTDKALSIQDAEKNFKTWCAGKLLSVKKTKRPIGYYKEIRC